MSINHEDESIFIMGTEGGGVIQGSFNSLIPVSCKSCTLFWNIRVFKMNFISFFKVGLASFHQKIENTTFWWKNKTILAKISISFIYGNVIKPFYFLLILTKQYEIWIFLKLRMYHLNSNLNVIKFTLFLIYVLSTHVLF